MDIGESGTYLTSGGISVTRTHVEPEADPVGKLASRLDEQMGVLLTSSFEYPGRYTKWDLGFCDPPLSFTGRGRNFDVRACNERGAVLLPAVENALRLCDAVEFLEVDGDVLGGSVRTSGEWFPEELRVCQPSLFSVVRSIINVFRSPEDSHLGLYGAFGFELAYQFDPIRLSMKRDEHDRNLVLFIPDELLIVNHQYGQSHVLKYDFEVNGKSTTGIERTGTRAPFRACKSVERNCDHVPGQYAETVRAAIEAFRRGDLFEVVPSQTFFEPCTLPPSKIFRRLQAINPAPYGALMNLGDGEFLVAASPEMYVRSDGTRVETCPIAGTIRRGKNAVEDTRQIESLLGSEKAVSELTMCTDVDRNDKSRVCEADSVRVIGHRQIEMYSRLIHTVDHVEGKLREGNDALDAFLVHMWAVTVTGAPKRHAIQFIEDHEHSPRRWYGGAIGLLGFDGGINTGLTLRTMRIKDGIAEIRAGATLLFGSDPDDEEEETRLKASALLEAIRGENVKPAARNSAHAGRPGAGRRILMIDHDDSFVHTLVGYFRRTGAEVITFRSGFPRERIAMENPDLVVLSPGPGYPEDFGLAETIDATLKAGIPLFGVCLGLQGIVEFYGGRLAVLDRPMHGKPSKINVLGGRLLEGLPEKFDGGRYHSLYADRETFPEQLRITAQTDEGTIMAIEHPELPVAAVQFHPESILTLGNDTGLALVHNVMRVLGSKDSLHAR